MILGKKPFENIRGKGENVGYTSRETPAFSPFPTMFSTQSKPSIILLSTFILSSANAFNSEDSKFLSFGKSSPFTKRQIFRMV